ncbi:hypothetical protein [Litchfieldia salsa]|nr:hypothetical protein [Litchfieldia salsa]
MDFSTKFCRKIDILLNVADKCKEVTDKISKVTDIRQKVADKLFPTSLN